MNRLILFLLALILGAISATTPVSCVQRSIQFRIGCSGHLKRAADASTPEVAAAELRQALNYLEEHRITEGTTAALWVEPANDIGFWYGNLKKTYRELDTVSHSDSQLERANVLMRARETILDHGEDGERVTMPPDVELYPNNVSYWWWSWISAVGLTVATLMAGIAIFVDER